MITVEHLHKEYQSGDAKVVALHDVGFSIEQGEFVAITGKSGSGKSTLLYQMSALDYPTSGSVVIDKTDVTRLSKNARAEFRLDKLGFVFQEYALLPELTALENVMIPLLMRGVSLGEAKDRAAGALRRVSLGDRLGNRPSQLSGGQQQRVAIARAVAHDPTIIFADEPTANLDSETSKTVLDIFLDLHQNGQTLVMVTHEPEYAALAERIIQLSDGEIVSDKKTR